MLSCRNDIVTGHGSCIYLMGLCIKFMKNYVDVAARNMKRAAELVESLGLVEQWRKIGADVNLIGSFATGLLMKHLDIDLHVYTDVLSVRDSFAAVAGIASHKGVRHVVFSDLSYTEEACFEWHLTYRDTDGRDWTVDMIHILRGSAFDGFAENMARRISEVLTDETRDTILRLKYETPDGMHISGPQYYAAVLSDGVRDYEGLVAWIGKHRDDDLINWLP